MERTEISDLGEFGLIRRITKDWPTHQASTLRGIGDDAAVLDPSGQRLVVTTDMLCEGVHFDLSYAPLKHLGYKAVVVNLSDVCAMNAKPTQLVLGLGLSNRFSVEAVGRTVCGGQVGLRGLWRGFGWRRHDVESVGADPFRHGHWPSCRRRRGRPRWREGR